MKPTLEMEKPQIVIQPPCNAVTEKKSHTKRWVIGTVLGLLTLGVITAIVLVSVHIGTKITRDNYKEAMVTFTNVQSGITLTEKITVTNTEEGVEVPNEFRIIFDYEQGLMTMKFTNAKNDLYGVCYIAKFDVTSGESLDEVRNEIQGDVMERTMDTEPTEHQFASEGEQAARELLSPSARDMCRGLPLYWAREITVTEDSDGRSKRGENWRWSYWRSDSK